jgi:hypothetical protein
MNNILDTLIWVTLERDEDFLIVKETLTRMGVASKRDKKLFQSCHILHKQGRYAIVHFKELFALDGKNTDFDDQDLARRNTIANLLAEWDLVKIVDPEIIADKLAPISQIKILSNANKVDWELVPKYNIGRKK